MKTLFIDARSDIEIEIPEKQLKELPKKTGIASTIQHMHKLSNLQKKIPESIIAGQVLGCNASKAKQISDKVDAFLYIGSGEFHPIEIAVETGKDVFCFNPFTREMKKIGKYAVEKHENRKKSALVTFLSSEKIGILVSSKPGQNRLKDALKLSERKDKKYYVFVFDTLDINQLENFNFVECWVNTACPRIADSLKKTINIDDIP